MTEEEWARWEDPRQLIHLLLTDARAPITARFTSRKMRLFAVACCRRAAGPCADARFQLALEEAERCEDARTNEERARTKAVRKIVREGQPWAASLVGRLAKALVRKNSWIAALECSWTAAYLVGGASKRSEEERFRQAPFLRDVIGNPFRPLVFSREWRTATALALALGMHKSRDFSALPILADALQDAGCEDDAILAHCRDPQGTHVRGCWVIDLVLGRA